MDENIVHAITMAAMAILFVVAFSCAIVAYDGLTDKLEQFFDVANISGKQEDATSAYMDSGDVEREVSFEEVYFGLLNLPRYVSTDGNRSNSKITVYADGYRNTYTATFDIDTNIKTILLDSTYYGNKTYNMSDENDMKNMLFDFCKVVLGGSVSGTSNSFLKARGAAINTTTFSIIYTGDSITYTKN